MHESVSNYLWQTSWDALQVVQNNKKKFESTVVPLLKDTL